MAPETSEVTVLGAGIAGAAVAYHLARAGVRPVLLVDPRTPAAGATGRAAGIVTEQMWNRWDAAVVRESQAEYAQLAARFDPGAYRVNGFVRWASTPEAALALRTARERLVGWGVDLREIPVSEVSQRLPWVRADDLRSATFAPGDGVVAPSRLAELYVQAASRLGVELRVGAPPGPVGRDGARWTVGSGERLVSSRSLVIAAGAWSKRLLADLGHPLPLVPYRTQAAVLRPAGAPVSDFPSFHDVDLDIYGRPEESGRVLVGNGTEGVEADPEAFIPGGDERFVTHLAESFERRIPGWADAEMIRAWAGVCVATPDRRPLVGAVPRAEGLYTITGFNGFGVMRAGGAAGRLVRRMTETAFDPADLAAVAPTRFPGAPQTFLPRPGFTLEAGDNPRF